MLKPVVVVLLVGSVTTALNATSAETRRGSVPLPWKPVRVEGASVTCWGRTHTIPGALPNQIASQGQALLAAPISFILSGEPHLNWKRGPAVTDERGVEWTSIAGGPRRLVQVRTRVEYDGFCQVDIEFGSGSYDGLYLDLPLKARHARYLHFVNESHYQEQNTLVLPERKGELWSAPFACMAWLGDDKVGLAWCADTDAPFQLARPEQALTIRRAGSKTTLRVSLIDRQVTLAAPVRWRFGLIATPVRPLPPRWREWRLAPGVMANTHILWWNSWTGSHADLTPKNPRALREQAQQLRAAGHHLLPYTALQALSESSTAYREGGDGWRREPLSSLQDEGTRYWIMCPNTDWSNFFPAQAERLCRDYGVNGLYYDFTFPYRCMAERHGCGYVDASGRRRGEFRVFALRKLAQETYERVKAADPDTRILMHTSGALMYPYIGFADAMLNGEQLRQPLAKAGGHYFNVLPLETLRAEYRGRHAGLAPFLIPELASPEGFPDPKLTSIPGPTTEMLALTLLHDIGVWPIYCHLETVEAVRQAQRDFGVSAARFIPYWERGPAATTSSTLLTSAWVNPSGLLLVVTNRSDVPAEARIRLRPRAGRWRSATDALTGEVLSLAAREVPLTVPARSFRLIRLHGNAERNQPSLASPRTLRSRPAVALTR